MRRILLTGATGFVGRHCVAPLLACGYEVHGTTSSTDVPRIDGVVWHTVDLTDQASVSKLIATLQPRELLHMAWYVTHGKFWTAPENLAWVRASLHLVEQFQRHGGERCVLAGTCAEYDWAYGHCVEHVTPTRPATLYGVCKDSLWRVVAAYSQQQKLSVAWGRIFMLYGPYEAPGRLVASVIRALLAQEEARISHGEQLRDLLYVQDAANAFIALLASEVQGAVNIASGQPVRLKEVALTIGTILGRQDLVRPGAVPTPIADPPLLTADVRRLHDEVGWRPGYTLEQGLRESVAWWRDQRES